MIKKEKFEQTPMGKGVVALSRAMDKAGMPPIEINVIGGFALMMYDDGIRDPHAITDIDYVGKPFPKKFNDLVDAIGNKYDLGSGWINNENMSSGITMEDYELATGELHFNKALEIGNITINVLDEKDVLKLKLLAVDSSLMGCEAGEPFTRSKDLPDVSKLLDKFEISCDKIDEQFPECLMFERTAEVIQAYKDGGLQKATELSKEIQKPILELTKNLKEQKQNQLPSSFLNMSSGSNLLSNMLDSAFKRAHSEPDFDFDDEPKDGQLDDV